jgi:hypothetical protein
VRAYVLNLYLSLSVCKLAATSVLMPVDSEDGAAVTGGSEGRQSENEVPAPALRRHMGTLVLAPATLLETSV